jgi:hypothetical protein
MKKNIISTIVCTIILFGWQAISWMVLPFHSDTLKYTPNQDAIIEVLSANLSENGLYGVPGDDPSREQTMEEMEAGWNKMLNKPWALVLYHTAFEGMTATGMMGGIMLNLVAVVIGIILLNASRPEQRTFGSIFGIVMLLPAFCIFQAVLENANWWGFPWHFLKGTIFDLLIGWSLCGVYLAWRYKKPNTAMA